MATIDKEMEITDAVVDELMDDWFDRDGDTFIKKREWGRVGWEKTLEEDEAYSAYLIEAPTKEELIKRAYPIAYETIVAMDTPFKIHIKISKGSESYTDTKVVCVSTKCFDDEELTNGEKLDVFLGITVHEGCHLLYTDFKETQRIKRKVIHTIFNILEDERIEELCGFHKPGFANFLEKSKYWHFDQYYLDYVVPKLDKEELTPFDRLVNVILKIIRYPKYLKEAEVIEFARYLIEVKKVVHPYPLTTADTVKAAYKIFDIIKDYYEDKEREEMEAAGVSATDIEIAAKAAARLDADAEAADSGLSKIAGVPVSVPVSEGGAGGLKEDDLSETVAADDGLLGEICEGRVEVGSSEDSFFTKMPEDQTKYMESLARVRSYIPAIAKIMKGHCREYKLIHRSMRSGVLDTTKIVEAYQGVPTVYIKEGAVTTDKIAVCILIDESGSMGGMRIERARDSAVLINEAIGNIPNVELFIYGHSGDIKRSRSTELYVYREKGYAPRFALGSIRARCENRDGVAISEIAKRVRTQTKNPCLFFIMSDGAPCAGDYGGATAMSHVKTCVEKVERMGFYVIQVCINHSYDPSRMFKHWVVMDDMSMLSRQLGNAIKKSATTMTKNHIV